MKKTETAYMLMVPGETEKKKWDHLVTASAQGNIYMLSWYLDVVAPGKWALITNEKMEAGFPVAFKKRTGYSNVYQPFYTMFFNVAGKEKIDKLLGTVDKTFNHLHVTSQNKSARYPCKERVRQEMPLKNFSTKTYSENALRQVKKAEKNGLIFEQHTDAREVVKLFGENKGRELKEYKPADFRMLEMLIKKSIEKKHGFCARVCSANKVLASGFFLEYQDRVIFLKGGVSEEGKKTGAMYYLMHGVIDKIKDRYAVFDFGGSNNKNVADFYRKLGGKDVVYYEIEIDQRNFLHRIVGKLRR